MKAPISCEVCPAGQPTVHRRTHVDARARGGMRVKRSRGQRFRESNVNELYQLNNFILFLFFPIYFDFLVPLDLVDPLYSFFLENGKKRRGRLLGDELLVGGSLRQRSPRKKRSSFSRCPTSPRKSRVNEVKRSTRSRGQRFRESVL